MQLYKYFLVSILFITHCLESNACGIAVHNEITYRSLENYEPKTVIEQSYKDDLLASPSYTQAGSFFPDWGYQCLGNNEQSEDAHWPTFIKTAINYIREQYPSHKYHEDKHVKGLVSFIFAVMSHGMADVKWHSLDGLSDYFVVAMAKSDFHGNTEESHIAADAGAEFTLRHSNKLSYLNETWHVPIKDIREIYKRLYESTKVKRKVPLTAHIQYCMAAAFAASKIDVEFGQLMFGYYGSKSPFLIEELYDYYRGGIEDMSGSVTDCFPQMVDAFENGIAYGTPDTLCADYFYTSHGMGSQCHHHTNNVSNSQIEKIYQQYDPTTGVLTLTFNPSLIQQTEQTHDLSPQVQKPSHSMRYQDLNTFDLENNQKCTSFKESNGITFTLPASSARLGHQIATGDFNGNGQLDMAISAPYDDQATGTVFILNSVNQFVPNNRVTKEQDIRNVSSQTLRGTTHHGRFGWSMATLDINQDGIDDLAISTPFDNRVDIYFGQRDKGISSEPQVVIKVELGTVLSAVDVNQDGFKDLVIGCPLCSVGSQPQVGRVFVVLSDKHKENNVKQPDFVIENPDQGGYQHFGESVVLMGRDTLLVGAPNFSLKKKQRVGKLYAFDMLTKSNKWTMTGSNEFQQFGRVIATDEQNILAISSPSEETRIGLQKFWQAGTVRLYDWEKIKDSPSNNFDMDHGMISLIQGRSNAGHLGQSLSINKYGNEIWIGEPMSEQENGRIYKWLFKSSVDRDEDLECIKNNHVLLARFGSQIGSLGLNSICITSQRYGQNARYSGAVTLLEIK